MTPIKELLDNAIDGNEHAFKDFLLDRLSPKFVGQWQMVDTVRYIREQTEQDPARLATCVPDIFLEIRSYLASFLQDAPFNFIQDHDEINHFLKLLKNAAKNNNRGAQTALLMLHHQNKHTMILNEDELNNLIKQAVQIKDNSEHNSHDHHFLGICYIDQLMPISKTQEGINKTAEHLTKAAESGNVYAMYTLAYAYTKGAIGQALPSQEARNSEAATFLKKAAKSGHVQSIHILADMYDDGDAGQELLSQRERKLEAARLLKIAAESGYVLSMHNLAIMYENGEAGEELLSQDAKNLEAEKWYKIAAECGYVYSMYNLAVWYQNGTAGQKSLSTEARNLEAEKWFKKAAALGHVSSMFNLAVMYLKGKAGQELLSQEARNLEAEKWFKKAAAQKHAISMYSLGWLYRKNMINQKLSPTDRLKIAKSYFQQALEYLPITDKGRIELAKNEISVINQELARLSLDNSSNVTEPAKPGHRSVISPEAINLLKRKLEQLQSTLLKNDRNLEQFKQSRSEEDSDIGLLQMEVPSAEKEIESIEVSLLSQRELIESLSKQLRDSPSASAVSSLMPPHAVALKPPAPTASLQTPPAPIGFFSQQLKPSVAAQTPTPSASGIKSAPSTPHVAAPKPTRDKN